MSQRLARAGDKGVGLGGEVFWNLDGGDGGRFGGFEGCFVQEL